MHFNELRLRNYSLFDNFRLNMDPKGVHIIIGPNASGKTQLVGSFLVPLFLKKSVIKYTPVVEKEAEIYLSIYGANNKQEIDCKLHPKGNDFEIISEIKETNPAGLNFKDKLLITLKEGKSPSLIFTNRIPNEKIDENDYKLIKTCFTSSPFSKTYDKDYQYILETYCKQKTSDADGSQGQRHFWSWLREFSYRINSKEHYPLIVDDEFSLMDYYHRRLICIMLSVLAEHSQIILFISSHDYISEINSKLIISTTNLQISKEGTDNSFGYKYGFLENLLQPTYTRKKTQTTIQNFNFGDIFRHEEDREYEFKEVKGVNPVSSIVNVADVYVVSFLNSNPPIKGKILWGITDINNRIVGVKLSRKERDDIKRLICEKFAQIEPAVVLSVFKINFHKVFDNNKELEDVFVLEITVPENQSKYLYATSGKEVYLKTDAGKRELTPLQTQLEILHRHGVEV